MPHLLKNPKDRGYNSMTINTPKWMLQIISEKYPNKSQFIRDAIKEYLEIIGPMVEGLETGDKVMTFASLDLPVQKINELCTNKYEISRSEMVRNAIRTKILKEISLEKEVILLEDDYILIRSYNGGRPFKTRRLE